jgi:4-amino-4-deoxy-L-arabinose transferase-like glycosyltransferase
MSETKVQESAVADKAAANESVEPSAADSDEKAPTSGVDRKAEGVVANASDAPSARDKADKKEPPLLAPGNAPRIVRGGGTAFVGLFAAFLLMAHDSQWRWGVPAGIVFLFVGCWGLMDLLGTFDDPDDRVAASNTLRDLTVPLLRAVGGLVAFLLTIAGGQGAGGSQWMWGILVTASFLLWVAAMFDVGVKLGPLATDELGEKRGIFARHGFWVLVAGAVLLFPAMGLYSLWDPWETHYGEVAREILSRDDWISLWWAQDGWFWSKPVLNFWIQSVAMASLGLHYKADEMLLDGAGHATRHPEWVVRTPNMLMTLVALYILYKGIAKVFGRRAGLISGLVLATTPDWYYLAHQTMTDMPCVAGLSAAMGLVIVALHTDDNQIARVYEIKAGKIRFRLSAWHLAIGFVLLIAVPQILYLFSRNLELLLRGPYGFRPHWDEFWSGSKGNCGLPGNENCVIQNPASIPKGVDAHPDGFGPSMLRFFGGFEPVLQGLVWAVMVGFLLWVNWGERRVKRLLYIGAWTCASVATMAKGPEGLGIPVVATLLWMGSKNRWRELLRIEILSGTIIWVSLVFPWFVAMYVRHGAQFTDRLLFHDMFNRALHHVHDTNEGDDTSIRFYLWQLGYALFPWTALTPLGLLYWIRRNGRNGSATSGAKQDVSILLFMWFLLAFALVSFMGTKFHHYIAPAVPAVALLIGIALSDMLDEVEPAAQRAPTSYLLGTFAGVVALLVGISRLFPGSILGDKEIHGEPPAANVGLGVFLAAVGVGILFYFLRAFRRSAARDATVTKEATEERPEVSHDRVMVGAALTGGALLLALVGRDLCIKADGADQPGAIRFLHLFTYNYRRAWPDSLDFSAILTAFVIVGALGTVSIAWFKYRRQAIYTFGAFAAAAALWGLDIYMVQTAPHWGQHEVIQAYYDARTSPDEQLIAYQMNWKGENFYTGNHVPAFVSTGANFTNWLKSQREKGVKVMFFITEHSRLGGLKGEVQAKAYKEITTKELNNKFIVVRAEL